MPIDPETGISYPDAVADQGIFGPPVDWGQDPNIAPPGSDVQPDRLTPAAQAALAAAQQIGLLSQGALGALASAGIVGTTASSRLAGVQTQTMSQRRAAGFSSPGGGNGQRGGGGCKGTRGECQVGRRRAQLYPATRVPDAFKLTHQAIKGYHCVFWRTTQIATFTRKKSANLFCRTFNEALSHLGSAQTFDIPTLAQAFAAVIDGGSGQWGLKNGFNPPFHGENGTPPDQ